MSQVQGQPLAPLLKVDGLSVSLFAPGGMIPVIRDVTFHVDPGEVLGVVGESGSGKSVTALSLLRLIPDDIAKTTAGVAWFQGQDLVSLSEAKLRRIRGREIGMIFQEPMTSLNPIATIGSQLREPLQLHLGMSKKQASERAESLLQLVGITRSRERLAQYPHELSGGMRQRVMIAMALSCEPKLLIADEPTTALDVTTQSQILELLRSLKQRLRLSIILITHDLGVIAQFADRVQVMYAGRAIEQASVSDAFSKPAHPYTRGLLQTVGDLERECVRLSSIAGTVPSLSAMPQGCAFAPRCAIAEESCTKVPPPLAEILPARRCACIKPFQASHEGTAA